MGKTIRRADHSRSENPWKMNKYGRGWRKKADRSEVKSDRVRNRALQPLVNTKSNSLEFEKVRDEFIFPKSTIEKCDKRHAHNKSKRWHKAHPEDQNKSGQYEYRTWTQNATYKTHCRPGDDLIQKALNKRKERRGNTRAFASHRRYAKKGLRLQVILGDDEY